MALLRYVDGEGRLHTRLLDSENFILGRANTCQLAIDSEMISREHLRIDLEANGRYRIRDLGSRNKTYVNGEQITETLLTGGDIVRAGDQVLEFLDDAGRPDAPDLDFLTPDRTEPPDCEWLKLKAPVSLTVQQVEQIARIPADQPLTARAEDLAQAALGQVLLDLQAERGFIALRGEKKTDLRPLAQRALKRPAGASLIPASHSFVLAPMLQQVAGRYPQTAGQINAKLGYAAAGVVAPLTHRGEVVGVLYVDRPSSKKPFPPSALPYAMAAGAAIGATLAEASRKLSGSAAREGAAWLTTLRRVQASLTTPVVGSDTFDVAVKFMPGRARCGDFATVLHVDEQRCGIVLIDGGGHGITGLVQGYSVQAAIRTALAVSEDAVMDPAAMFNAMNQQLAGSPSRQVLGSLYIGIDLSSGKLTYINAGSMPPLLIVGPGRLLTLDQPSLVLGVDRDYVYAATRVDIPESFRIVCYTDGFVEGATSGGEPLGEHRLHEALLDRDAFAPAAGVLTLITNLWASYLAGSASDDDALALVLSRG